MDRAKSISIEDVTKHAEMAAREVLGERAEKLGAFKAGVFKDIGTVGLIWEDPDFARFQPKDMLELSTKMAEAMGPIVAEARPVVKIFDKGITMGYFPIDPEFMGNFR